VAGIVRIVTASPWSDQMSKFFSFLKDESGATAIEYCLIAAGISVVIISSVNTIGSTLNAKFQAVSTKLQ